MDLSTENVDTILDLALLLVLGVLGKLGISIGVGRMETVTREETTRIVNELDAMNNRLDYQDKRVDVLEKKIESVPAAVADEMK